MSSRPLTVQKGPIVENQGQQFQTIWKNSISSQTNPSTLPSHTSAATRLRGPKPFYRSRITPDPFDYSNETRRQNDYPDYVQRRFSFCQNNGTSQANSYESDQEPAGKTIGRQSQFTPKPYRSVTPTPTTRPVISVGASQSPMITIGRRAPSPSLSEIRIAPATNPSKSVTRTISVSRPESPSISIQRPGNFQANAQEKVFQISMGNGQKSRENPTSTINSIGQNSPLLQREKSEHRSTSNIVANRFKPLIAFTSPAAIIENKGNRRFQGVFNLPPNSSTSTINSTNGNHSNGNRNGTEHLKNLLMKTIHRSSAGNFFGMCARCHDEILGEENGLVAMDRMYHVACFTCTMCGGRLRGMHFYSMENQPYCESCYIHSLEKCVACAQPISDRVLRANGKAYHAPCFCCAVCRKSLDGVPFTIDIRLDVHCIDCFHQKFAPRCFSCHLPILPSAGQDQTIRIVACDRNYHIECYRCQNCQIQLNDEQGCYPIEEHIFCSNCYLFYAKTRLTYS